MSEADSVTGPLDSVRQLERALEASATAGAAAEALLQEARSEASRLLATARENALAAAAERRRSVLAAADADAATILGDGAARSARLRADARAVREEAVGAAIALIVAAADGSEV